MGKKLDALLGRNFRPAKFKPTVNLASRTSARHVSNKPVLTFFNFSNLVTMNVLCFEYDICFLNKYAALSLETEHFFINLIIFIFLGFGCFLIG